MGPRWYLEWQRDTQGCQRLGSVEGKEPRGLGHRVSPELLSSLLALASLTFGVAV